MRWPDNGIGTEGIRTISEVLKNNNRLTTLHLSCDRKKKGNNGNNRGKERNKIR